MANFISEDMIEQAILNKLRQENFGYDVIVCDTDPSHREYLNDGTGRANKKACVAMRSYGEPPPHQSPCAA